MCKTVSDVNNQTAGSVVVKQNLALAIFNPDTGDWDDVYSELGSITLQPWGSITGWTVDFELQLLPGTYVLTSSLYQLNGRHFNLLDAETHHFTVQ